MFEDDERVAARTEEEVLPRLLLRTIETLEEEDFAFDYGYIYRLEDGI